VSQLVGSISSLLFTRRIGQSRRLGRRFVRTHQRHDLAVVGLRRLDVEGVDALAHLAQIRRPVDWEGSSSGSRRMPPRSKHSSRGRRLAWIVTSPRFWMQRDAWLSRPRSRSKLRPSVPTKPRIPMARRPPARTGVCNTRGRRSDVATEAPQRGSLFVTDRVHFRYHGIGVNCRRH